MLCKGRACLVPETRDDIDRAFRKTCFGSEFGDAQYGQTGILGRLQHGRVAHGQCGTKGAARHLRRIIPGNHMPGNAERLAFAGDVVAVHEGNLFAMKLVCGTAVELEVARCCLNVGTSGANRLAAIAGLDRCQFLGIVQNQLRQPRQKATALGSGKAPPGAGFEGCTRRSHGAIDIAGVSGCDLGKDRTFRRRHHRQRASRRRRFPAVVDEAAFCRLQSGLTRIVFSHAAALLHVPCVHDRAKTARRIFTRQRSPPHRRRGQPWRGE